MVLVVAVREIGDDLKVPSLRAADGGGGELLITHVADVVGEADDLRDAHGQEEVWNEGGVVVEPECAKQHGDR